MCNISKLLHSFKDGNLVAMISMGMVFGAVLGYICFEFNLMSLADGVSILGDLFVGALKAIAPVLVFILVTSSIATKHISGNSKSFKSIMKYYLLSTFGAAFIAVCASFIFPVELSLKGVEALNTTSVQSMSEVFKTILFKIVDNPINALATGNYIGILSWAVAGGIALRHSSSETKNMISNMADAVTKIVRFIIKLAPIGIFGIVTFSVYESGGKSLLEYARLLVLIVGVMSFIALIINPLIAFSVLKKNPYPLVFTCIKESGITAFFTRSSAANIPVNLGLCKKLKLNEELYSISIPLGANVNMAGAAITISILALATVNSIDGLSVNFTSALLLSIISAIGACGSSGVAGGSLMLVPLSCSLFGISNDIAMQVVTIGFSIGVIQDSVETALNSSSDVLFTAIASMSEESA